MSVRRAARRATGSAILAVGLLTIVPVRARRDAGGLGSAAPWMPVVGAFVGAGAAAVHRAADGPLDRSVAAVLAVAWLIVVTGALHVDGLADCADALGVRGGRERRLAVMRESTIGTFGVVAIVLYALLLATAIAGLRASDVPGTLVVAGALSRWSAVAHALFAPPARPDGLGAAFVVTPVAMALATAAAGGIAAALLGLGGVVGLAAAMVAVVVTTTWARRALGGRTGDTLGATVAVAEALVVMALLASSDG